MRLLHWICVKTRRDMIRNNDIKERVRAAPILEKMGKTRIWWFVLVERRFVDVVVRRVDQMEDNQITRGRGRLRKTIKIDLEINELD
jgi:hypothetical protein